MPDKLLNMSIKLIAKSESIIVLRFFIHKGNNLILVKKYETGF